MRSFKVKWSETGRGGSFIVSFEEAMKTFDVHSSSVARAPFDVVLNAIQDIVKEHFSPEIFSNPQRKNPYRIVPAHNMSTRKWALEVLEETPVFKYHKTWVPKVYAQLTESCSGNTGFGWDERNNCTFLPVLALFIKYFTQGELKLLETRQDVYYSFWETNTFDWSDIEKNGFIFPEKEEIPGEEQWVETSEEDDDEKLVID